MSGRRPVGISCFPPASARSASSEPLQRNPCRNRLGSAWWSRHFQQCGFLFSHGVYAVVYSTSGTILRVLIINHSSLITVPSPTPYFHDNCRWILPLFFSFFVASISQVTLVFNSYETILWKIRYLHSIKCLPKNKASRSVRDYIN